MPKSPYIASTVLMVRPSYFAFNEETAASNAFQNRSNDTIQQTRTKALAEYQDFVNMLRDAGIRVLDTEDFEYPHTPDAVFPNNWFQVDARGQRVILFPMLSELRQQERRPDIIHHLRDTTGFAVDDSLLQYEDRGLALEGTGSLILDHANRIGYAAVSPRTVPEVLNSWSALTGFEVVSFTSLGPAGEQIYHTNVMMTLCENLVVIAMDSIFDDSEKKFLRDSFEKTNKEILEITLDQMSSFAGNMLQLQNDQGQKYLVMSDTAYQSLNQSQVRMIQKHDNIILHPSLNTIETIGGGSARCMLAEIFF